MRNTEQIRTSKSKLRYNDSEWLWHQTTALHDQDDDEYCSIVFVYLNRALKQKVHNISEEAWTVLESIISSSDVDLADLTDAKRMGEPPKLKN